MNYLTAINLSLYELKYIGQSIIVFKKRGRNPIMKKVTFMLIAVLMLNGCISLIRMKDTDRLLYGMTRQQVRNLLGEPLNFEQEGNVEIYHYELAPGYFSRDRYDYYVKFVDRKIVAFGHHLPTDAPQ